MYTLMLICWLVIKLSWEVFIISGSSTALVKHTLHTHDPHPIDHILHQRKGNHVVCGQQIFRITTNVTSTSTSTKATSTSTTTNTWNHLHQHPPRLHQHHNQCHLHDHDFYPDETALKCKPSPWCPIANLWYICMLVVLNC